MKAKDLLQQVVSEEMLEKELKKLESAKIASAKVAETIQAEIAQLNKDLVLAKATSSTDTKVLRDRITVLGKERTALAVAFSAEKTQREQVLEDLDKEIEIKKAEKTAIDTSSRKADDLLEKKAVDIEEQVAQLEELRVQVAQEGGDLAKARQDFEDAQVIAQKELKDLTAELIKRTDIAIAEGKATKAGIAKNEALIKNMAERSAELDKQLSEIQAATPIKVALDNIEKELDERKEGLDVQLADMKAGMENIQDREASVKMREAAIVAREKKVMLGERQLREARNGQN